MVAKYSHWRMEVFTVNQRVKYLFSLLTLNALSPSFSLLGRWFYEAVHPVDSLRVMGGDGSDQRLCMELMGRLATVLSRMSLPAEERRMGVIRMLSWGGEYPHRPAPAALAIANAAAAAAAAAAASSASSSLSPFPLPNGGRRGGGEKWAAPSSASSSSSSSSSSSLRGNELQEVTAYRQVVQQCVKGQAEKEEQQSSMSMSMSIEEWASNLTTDLAVPIAIRQEVVQKTVSLSLISARF